MYKCTTFNLSGQINRLRKLLQAQLLSRFYLVVQVHTVDLCELGYMYAVFLRHIMKRLALDHIMRLITVAHGTRLGRYVNDTTRCYTGRLAVQLVICEQCRRLYLKRGGYRLQCLDRKSVV